MVAISIWVLSQDPSAILRGEEDVSRSRNYNWIDKVGAVGVGGRGPGAGDVQFDPPAR